MCSRGDTVVWGRHCRTCTGDHVLECRSNGGLGRALYYVDHVLVTAPYMIVHFCLLLLLLLLSLVRTPGTSAEHGLQWCIFTLVMIQSARKNIYIGFSLNALYLYIR